MKKTKYISIGLVLGFCVFLAIAAFPPTWNSGQFRSSGGIFSHLPGGNLGTNQSLTGELIITNSANAELEVHSGSSGTSTIRAFIGGTEYWDIFFNDTSLSIHRAGSGDAFLIEADNDVNVTANLIFSTAGKGLQIKTGANATADVATLVNGTVTVNNTAVTASSMIFFSRQNGNASAAYGVPEKGTVVAGTSFVINSRDLMASIVTDDGSTIAWWILEPAP